MDSNCVCWTGAAMLQIEYQNGIHTRLSLYKGIRPLSWIKENVNKNDFLTEHFKISGLARGPPGSPPRTPRCRQITVWKPMH